MKYFNEIVDQSISRARESTLSILSVNDQDLREHLAEQFSDELGADGCFLAPPVFEHTFGWEPAEPTLAELSGDVFTPELLNTLEHAPAYRFTGDMHPYAHQLHAWKTLANSVPQSAVITSGTGSGKTECFMLPILDDLIRETERTKKPLVGVRALFLYPLNALINSQQERLDAWTKTYGDRIRFCLYNGMTENSASKVRKDQQQKPNQVMSRELLREEPAPILMTNSTMLEYMLVRQVDRPILEISRESKSLRWIVLDEAHTYIGSNAAEMSLLLRRVVQAFGKDASEIRFVATSATISGEDSQDRLAQYLADLAGVSKEQVSVIGGNRVWPSISLPDAPKSLSINEIVEIDSGIEVSPARYEALTSAVIPSSIREAIVSNKTPLNINEIVSLIETHLTSTTLSEKQRDVLEWFNVMTSTYKKEGDQPFLKVRAHFYQRMLHGLWACINPACTEKTSRLSSWPFGNVYVEQRVRCGCGSTVFELSFCKDCSTPHLLAEDRAGVLCQPSPYAGDEFSLAYDDHDDEVNDDSEEIEQELGAGQKLVIAQSAIELDNYFQQNLNVVTDKFGGPDSADNIKIMATQDEGSCCSHCESSKNSVTDFYRRAHLGAPFYVANAVPTILEFCPDPVTSSTGGKSPEALPGRGRKLITFTDSRQGTARMAVRMQQEAERSRLRGLVFETLRNEQYKNDKQPHDIPTGSADEMLEQALTLEKMGLASQAKIHRAQAEAKARGEELSSPVAEMKWDDMVESIASTFDITESILDYNKYTNPAMFDDVHGSRTMARMLLAREFSRRPKNQNSSETLGLISIGYDGISNITSTPEHWAETLGIAIGRGVEDDGSFLSLQDWKDFLTVALDFYVRENTFLGLDRTMQRWMGGHFAPKVLFPPLADIQQSATVKNWPLYQGGAGSRLPKLLQLASNSDLGNTAKKDKVNYWLEAAWLALVDAAILQQGDTGYKLNLSTLTFSLPKNAWVCSATQKLIPTTFRSLTPYLPLKLQNADYRCERRTLPDLVSIRPDGGSRPKLKQIREHVSQNAEIALLRSENLWTDISDRTVEGGFYYRTAEHSAQQSSKKLEMYEEMFKKGKINVLNCSTTMEMGVDIGGISAVVMNNLPPHPANYLQRSGRAGRRSEARSVSYTLCKADPHNQRAFRNPQWPFITAIPAPHITLSSDRIVQRHVNSFLLSAHLSAITAAEGDRTKLTVQWFFAGDSSPCDELMDWLRTNPKEVKTAVNVLVSGTALESSTFTEIASRCIEKINDIQQRWLLEHQLIESKLLNAKEEAYKMALSLELSRHENEYLLRDLSARTFLPGHGFPTDVVSLNTYNIEDFIEKSNFKKDSSREDNIFNLKEQPSRELSVAIREYAPGAQIVIDGRVHVSAGVSLQWQPGGFDKSSQKFDIAWRCSKCGSTGMVENAYANSDDLTCTQCQHEIPASQKRTVLRPKGFLTDFFESTTNDITSQKFIRVEKPRVQLEESEILAFPDSKCGYVRHGHRGSVFYHSSGDNEKGYAVCLTCGKAASMSAAGDIPKNIGMLPDQEHRPIGGLTGSHKAHDCSGAAVKKDVYLGYQVPTDVVEILLRNPVTGQWLSDSDNDRIIATTLAVAIRDVIADRLGIASTEMGFNTRPDKDLETGVGRSVIQLFDQVSGGAGFVLAELAEIVSMISDAAAKLECPNNCETVCSHCLASQDSRVEREPLDRLLTKKWLAGAEFIEHLSLSGTLSSIPGAKYCSLGPLHTIQKALRANNDQPNLSLEFALNRDIEEWNLDDTHFRQTILTWVLTKQYDVRLGIPDPSTLPDGIKRSLSLLGSLGVKYFALDNQQNSEPDTANCIAQIKSVSSCQSLYSTSPNAGIPGEQWMQTAPDDMWASTKDVPWSEPVSIDLASLQATASEGASVVEINNEFDGDIAGFAGRVRSHLTLNAPHLIALLENESPSTISYTDRYVKSPWSALLLGEFIKIFASNDLVDIFIDTMAPKPNHGQRGSNKVEHDWPVGRAQQDVISGLIIEATSVKPVIRLHRNAQKIEHGRVMTLGFPSGKKCVIFIDQGMGYWKPVVVHEDHLNFNFGTKSEHQPSKLLKFRDSAKCGARGMWSTHMVISVS